MNNYINELKRSVAINEKLLDLYDGSIVYVVIIYTENNDFTIFSMLRKNTGSEKFGIFELSDEEILAEAKKLSEPQYIHVEALCLDLIGKTVYVNKDIEIIVESIHKNFIVATDGSHYLKDDLWFKE